MWNGVPDISIVAKLCTVLNTDIDNLLEGNTVYLEHRWKGILISKNQYTNSYEELNVYIKN